jgi:hypothetical protein
MNLLMWNLVQIINLEAGICWCGSCSDLQSIRWIFQYGILFRSSTLKMNLLMWNLVQTFNLDLISDSRNFFLGSLQKITNLTTNKSLYCRKIPLMLFPTACKTYLVENPQVGKRKGNFGWVGIYKDEGYKNKLLIKRAWLCPGWKK